MRGVGRATIIRACIAYIASTFAGHTAFAQQAVTNPSPQIIVSGSAEVLLPPAKASFSIGITTSAPSAATAGDDNARISRAVVDALERAGLKREEISGSRLAVRPVWSYDDKGRHPKRSAFEANNTIELSTENLSQIGNYIDAALSAGATDASEITFSAKDVDEARHRTLAQAVVAARTDAEAMARAAGGMLGDLLLLSTERVNETPGVNLEEVMITARTRAPAPVSTDVIPSQIKVTARVVARWRFVATAIPK